MTKIEAGARTTTKGSMPITEAILKKMTTGTVTFTMRGGARMGQAAAAAAATQMVPTVPPHGPPGVVIITNVATSTRTIQIPAHTGASRRRKAPQAPTGPFVTMMSSACRSQHPA